MIRLSSIYRSDSQRGPRIEADANNIREDSIDCGITALRCCNTTGCQKLGNKKTFLTILVLCGIAQGATESYFRISAKQAALAYGYDPQIIDWLLVANSIFQGLLAVAIAYWGNRIHRTAWMGGLFMLQGILCFMVIIPVLIHNDDENDTIEAVEITVLCIRTTSGHLMREQAHSITTLILLFVLQFGIAMGAVAFYTLGFTYLDDNVHEHESPALLGGALAGKFWGIQIGSFISMIVGITSYGWWLGWVFLSPFLFTLGFLVVMFPKKMLATVVRHAANNIIETAVSSSNASIENFKTKFIADIDFIPSMRRILTNKILITNALAATFVQTAFINFSRNEALYLQSRFFIPMSGSDGFSSDWSSQLVSSLLKSPIVSLSVLVAGLIIAKSNVTARKLVIWNIIAGSMISIFFIASIFIDCENSQIAGAHRGKIIKPYCAHSCICSENIPFTPVCPENGDQSFYNPCYAGCGAEIIINNIRVYGNCSCGIDTQLPMEDLIATEGACGMADCQPYWIAFQILIILAAALLGSTLVGKLVISLRCVMPQDKSIALSIELFLIGLIANIPGKLLYQLIASKTCQYFAPDHYRCFLHESPRYGDWINILNSSFILIGVMFEIALLIFIGDLPMYGESEEMFRSNPVEIPQNTELNIVEPVMANSRLLGNFSTASIYNPTTTSSVTYATVQKSRTSDYKRTDDDNSYIRLQQGVISQQDNVTTSPNPRLSLSSTNSGYTNVPSVAGSYLYNQNNKPPISESSF